MSAGIRRDAEEALAALVARGRTLAVAESLTGGLVAAALTAVPGASRAVRGAVTAYATDVKRDVLGVDARLLAERGAVDPEVARQMAGGVRALLAADWGLATTGVAGPDPQDGKPVGTVFVAAAGPDGTCAVRELALDGGREPIRTETVRAVLALLLDELTGNAGAKDTEHKGGNGCLQP
ncbi:CinA family protein [Streptomyces sp. I05A-00742]|uniref:CinA family protein n=1 Tax=Streptomyces sp. I05A-00742 TaxID=2732853 RepID=UPI00148A0799|nr:CinA family protein [Streptomyces sp. I05A-00742]